MRVCLAHSETLDGIIAQRKHPVLERVNVAPLRVPGSSRQEVGSRGSDEEAEVACLSSARSGKGLSGG